LTLVFPLSSWERSRPGATDATAEFSRHYPTAEVISIRMSEDEVVARSFEITCRVRGEPQTKTFNLQHMENEKGLWEPRPALPSELP